MGLLGRMRSHASRIDCDTDTPNTSCTPIPSPPGSVTNGNISTISAASIPSNLSCPHCHRAFPSHIALIGHFQIDRTENGEPVHGTPTYSHRMRLLDHMRFR
ncbi:unnamed protein product [Schistocephalus solidus]|uniref:C2H2-type domain-containing protein n=1 Tax=Schistocephalus solidus TaxID=70667 RepID=A0A183TAC6_SCHSO|nr:unnamed protein product [Schistocephalus solidus]